MQQAFVLARALGAAVPSLALFAGTALPASAAVGTVVPLAHARYLVRALPLLGGSAAAGNSINDTAWVTGASNVQGNGATHATLWLRGLLFDLGTLGGPNSAVDWPVKNVRGNIVGNAETSALDPLGENFCRYGTGHICQGFLYRNGVMGALVPLPGGNNSYAAGENSRDLIVGWAEDSTQDSSCDTPQVLQYEAVTWGPALGSGPQELGPLPPYPDGAAVAVNESQQVVGISGPCADADGGGAARAVLWQNGTVTDLGNFGGTIFNTADAINSNGDIAGFSELAGNTTFHAFLWTKAAGIRDLGTLPGDNLSEALGINDQGQIVGGSCDANFNCRAFIWQNGVMTDLNDLIAPRSPLYLNFAGDINNRGEIAGLAYDQNSGVAPAFIARPRGGETSASPSRKSHRITLPSQVRQMLRLHALRRVGPGR